MTLFRHALKAAQHELAAIRSEVADLHPKISAMPASAFVGVLKPRRAVLDREVLPRIRPDLDRPAGREQQQDKKIFHCYLPFLVSLGA